MARLPNLRRLKLPEQDLKKSTVCHLLNLPLQQISNLKTNDDLGAINHFPFNLRVIPSAFFSNCSIRAIDITVPSRVSQIGENFCEEVRNLAFVRIANQSLRWNINGAFEYCEHLSLLLQQSYQFLVAESCCHVLHPLLFFLDDEYRSLDHF